MKLYLDVCSLNRPFDDQAQVRIRLEAEAVLLILEEVTQGQHDLLGSEILIDEIRQTPDLSRQARVSLLLKDIKRVVQAGDAEADRARQLITAGFHAADALHLACAESGDVEVFLTTDDRLLRLAARISAQLKVKVTNPLQWLLERATT